MMTLTGQRLKALREERGMSQADVAKSIGVGRTTYLKYENGENRPVRKLNELAKLFNVSFDYLLANEEKSQIKPYLSNEQTKLLNAFDSLDTDGKNVLWGVINSLSMSHSKINAVSV